MERAVDSDKSIPEWLKLDEDITVIFRSQECSLRDAIEKCRPGETISGVDIKKFEILRRTFEERRGREFSYCVDDRYGPWRFILTTGIKDGSI